MAVARTVLVVSPTPAVATAVVATVRRSGYEPVLVRGFNEAKRLLSAAPHLVVTELKLGEYNGLQLALRAATTEIPTIVVADEGFENEVEQLGATWVSSNAVDGIELRSAMVELLQGAGARQTTLGWEDGETLSGVELATWELGSWEPGSSEIRH